jgi:predicted amidohydrolase YtcJ
MEDEIGSSRAGERANFTALGDDPCRVDAEELGNITIWSTIFEGVPYPLE